MGFINNSCRGGVYIGSCTPATVQGYPAMRLTINNPESSTALNILTENFFYVVSIHYNLSDLFMRDTLDQILTSFTLIDK